ncbi:MAG: hypothetical protein IKB34_05975 [Clostridia bacterium]|nr:hypothetical protein [Clostridia bacterium]
MFDPKELKKRLDRASDSELQGIILTVAAASGMDKASAEAICADIPGLRRQISGLDDRRFLQLLAAIGGGKGSEAIKKMGLK